MQTDRTPAAASARTQSGVDNGDRIVGRRRFDAFVTAIVASRVDIAIVAAITLLAAVLRLWHLGTVPLGLHGDEAWTGLDARRVLHEGYIGPYLRSAVGQPIGPLYFTALLFKLTADTTFTLRLSMALFGIATIPLAYCAFATMFNRTVAAFAAILLAVMMWHLHLSRTGFMVTSWPFIEMAILLTLWHAMRRNSLPLFVVAGALTGLGVYTYNAYTLFLPVPFVALAWWYAPRRARPSPRLTVAIVALFVITAVATSLPMIRYVSVHTSQYRYHQRVVSVTDSEPWKQAGALDRADLLWTRAREWERGLVYGNRPDFGDGLATEGHPVIDRITVLLALVGLAFAIWNWRRAEYAVVLASALILPWGAILTVNDGLFRRTLGLAPFVAVLAALPLAWLWERIARAPNRMRFACLAALLAVPAYIGATTTRAYFGPVQDTYEMTYVYPYQLDAASRYMATLPDGTYVYLFSARWGFDYETRRYLAPNVIGIDRSREFRDGLPFGGPLDFSVPPERGVVFVFLVPYIDQLQAVSQKYPGGVATEGARGSEILFRAYYLPSR